MAPNKLVLIYFDMPGIAEPIRWVLAQSGLEWEDKRLSKEEFGELKPTLPNGQVPILEIDGYPLPQSQAIFLYVGKIGGDGESTQLQFALSFAELLSAFYSMTLLDNHSPLISYRTIQGLYPTDYLEAAKCDAILGSFGDLWLDLRPILYEKDEARKMELRAEFVDNFLPTWLGNMEKKLGQTEGLYFLDKMTLADISMANLIRLFKAEEIVDVPPSVFDACPKLMALTESVMAEPKIAEFIAKTGTPK